MSLRHYLERDRLAAVEILTMLAEAGISGAGIGPDRVNERVENASKVDPQEFVAVAYWLESEGFVRLPDQVDLSTGNFPGVTLTAEGFEFLGKPSPIDPNDNVYTALVKHTEPSARSTLAEFIVYLGLREQLSERSEVILYSEVLVFAVTVISARL